MNLTWFDELDSTSEEVSRRLDAGNSDLPFAIGANTQSAGKGQRGRTWQSPRGNFYLSMAVEIKGKHQLSYLPLFTGLVLAEWLQNSFNVNATLKWPNDLLVNGSKIAGILCECQIQGDKTGPAIIGIGLNVHHTPPTPESAYRVISLHDANATHNIPPMEELVKRFLDYWEAQGTRLNHCEDWLKEYSKRMIQPGHFLFAPDGKRVCIKAIDGDGSLRVLETGQERNLHSAAESWRWHIQTANQIFVADIGNTAIKLGVANFTPTGIEIQQTATFLTDEPIPDHFQELAEPGSIIYAMSVNPHGLKVMLEKFRQLGVNVIPLRKRRLRTAGAYPLSELGIDRLAACEAFVQRFSGEAGIVASCGTAVTVDVIDASGRHLGGWIAPGIQKSLEIMSQSTAQLPSLRGGDPNTELKLGTSTSSAMRFGVKASIAGMIHEAGRHLSVPPRIVLTGGQAPEISACIPDAVTIPSLLLEGAACLAFAGQ